jgi:hypothetical protein
MVKEVGELELGEGLPKGKLREPSGNENDRMRLRIEDAPKGAPICPYIESEVKLQRRRFSQPRGHDPEEGGLANLACKLRHLMVYV